MLDEDKIITHQDILNMIKDNEKRVENWFKAVFTVFTPLFLGALVWIWSEHSAQAAFNADINARTQGNMVSYELARQTQARIETRLDEINRFLREDSKEMRDALSEHIRTANGK